MKHLLAALALIATPVLADGPSRETCEIMHGLAENVMTVRQNNTSMVVAMQAAHGDPYVESMVRAAYREPRFNTDKHREIIITDFANRVYLECLDRQ